MAVISTSQFNRRRTPQQEPIPGSNQVANNAGGFSYQLDKWGRLDRFLILGTEGGTYYVAERALLKENHASVKECLAADGSRAIARIVEVSEKGLAHKNEPAIFALAVATAVGDAKTKEAAYQAVSKVCRIGTHLFHFVQYVNAMRGWGRGIRRAVGAWYTARRPEDLAFQAIKYQQRDGWAHRDVLRLAHTRTSSKEQDAVFRWMIAGLDGLAKREVKRKIGKESKVSNYPSRKTQLPELIEAFEAAKKADEKELVKLITEHNLPREAVPTEKLNSLAVWEALLEKMPMTAMIRNLGKMTNLGLIKPLSGASRKVIKALSSEEALKKARIHPMTVLVANRIYDQGKGDKGSLTWTPVPAISQALDEAFYKTFQNVVPTGKPLLVGLDVSGSMGSPLAGTCLRCCEGTAALSLIHASVEPEIHVMGFADRFVDLGIRKGMTLGEATRCALRANFGTTDCSLAIEWAVKNKVEVGGIVIMTDSETGSHARSGQRHPSQAMMAYRNQFVSDARLVVVGMASNGFTISDPDDKFSLDVVGFDASAPAVIANFIRD